MQSQVSDACQMCIRGVSDICQLGQMCVRWVSDGCHVRVRWVSELCLEAEACCVPVLALPRMHIHVKEPNELLGSRVDDTVSFDLQLGLGLDDRVRDRRGKL